MRILKNRISVIFLCVVCACSTEPNEIKLRGEAQGTTYSIKYWGEGTVDYQPEIDSILKSIDRSLSTYMTNSLISKINKGDTGIIADTYFKEVFEKSIEIAARTGGVFDPTVAPLVNAWGFGVTGETSVDSALIDSLLHFVGYEKVKLYNNKIIKENGMMLDFNAIAQGYTVDVIGVFLESMGANGYMVELGGEVKVKNTRADGKMWKIGIDKPVDVAEERQLQTIAELKDKAMATSGSYRKYYEKDGIKYSHFIDPQTGYPIKHNLLSATVIANDCMSADAYATAFMVMGMEHALQFIQKHKELGLEVYFIFTSEDGRFNIYMTEGMMAFITSPE